MVTLEEIKEAQRRIRGVAVRTPLVAYHPPPVKRTSGKGLHSPDDLDDLLTAIGTQGTTDGSRQLYFKPESFQPIGSFKLRGAYNKVASLTTEERLRGVITYSSGNHAQGVAYAARAVGAPVVVVMPRNSPRIKMIATEALGAEIVVVGPGSIERTEKAEALAHEHGYVIVPPYNDAHIIAGQGTVGLEIFEDLQDADIVLVPVGGGGLISGVSAALKLSGSRAKIVGVEPQLANDAQQSFRAGKIVQIAAERASSTLADGLRTQSIGPLNFEHVSKYVDDIITVSEDEIRRAMRQMATNARLVAEPSGAVTFAAWLFHEPELPAGQKVVAVISGGNVEPELLSRVMTEGNAV
jgi:threonine dehydratase